jgi:hypothetical protein
MASWTDEWDVRYGRPRGSIELPVHETFDVKAWAKEIAKGVLPPDAPRKTVKELAAALADATLDSRARDPISATFFCPDPALGELARIELIAYHPDEQYPEITLELMAGWLSSPTPQSLRPAEVRSTDLPIGPAVRVTHQYVAADKSKGGGPGSGGESTRTDGQDGAGSGGGSGGDGDGDGDGEGLGTIVQTCAYAIRPPQTGSALLLMASWRALAYSDRLFDLTDSIAGKMRLERK